MKYINLLITIVILLISFQTFGQVSSHVRVEGAPDDGVLSIYSGSHGFKADSNTFIGFYAINNDRGVVAQQSASYGMGADFNGEDGFRAAANQTNGFYALLNTDDGFESRNNGGNGFLAALSGGYGVYAGMSQLDDGYFEGDVTVNGSLSKGAGSFKIDHPLDPENKYLYHSFVESPDMMNIYNGNITTDQTGFATVTMPDWFDALNADFRYQLTVIGSFAQAIISSKMEGNQFVIQTDKPQIEVSWQVTGIRHDAYAKANRIPVEQEKEEQYQGQYIHYKAFGQPFEKSVMYINMGEKSLQELEGDYIPQIE